MESITIRRPDDLHVHLRDDDMMPDVLPYTAAHFARALVMPNLVPPITTIKEANNYRMRIKRALPSGSKFEPLMTCYLTDGFSMSELMHGFDEGYWIAGKLYPANATTNSAHGVTSIEKIMPLLERMAQIGMPVCIHGEMLHVNGEEVDIFDRERVFIDRVLDQLRVRVPELKIVLEHITTEEAAEYVEDAWSGGSKIAATITPHHLVINRNDLFRGGLRPHHYCLPVAKREKHRQALRRAATSGLPCFFLGTDSAPHPVYKKESGCGCAGIFCALTALGTYAQVFDEEGKLKNLEAFASLHGAAFYGLKPNEGHITLVRKKSEIPNMIGEGKNIVRVFSPDDLHWSVAA